MHFVVATVAAGAESSLRGWPQPSTLLDRALVVVRESAADPNVSVIYCWAENSTVPDDGDVTIRPDAVDPADPGRFLGVVTGVSFSSTIIVRSVSDLPAPVANVITLEEACYELQGVITLPVGVTILRPVNSCLQGRSEYVDALVGDAATPLIADTPGAGNRTIEKLRLSNLSGDVAETLGSGDEVVVYEHVLFDGAGYGVRVGGVAALTVEHSNFQGTAGGIDLAVGSTGSVTITGCDFASPGINVNADPAFAAGSFDWSDGRVNAGSLINASANFLDPGGRGLVHAIAVLSPATVATGGIERDPQWQFFSNIGMPNSNNTVNASFLGSSAYTFTGTTTGFSTIPSLLAVPVLPDPLAPERFILDPTDQEYVEYTGLDPTVVDVLATLAGASAGGGAISGAVKLQIDPEGLGAWVDLTGAQSSSQFNNGSFATGNVTVQANGVALGTGARIRAVAGRIDSTADRAGTIYALSLGIS